MVNQPNSKPVAPNTTWLEEFIDQFDSDITEAAKQPADSQAVIITLDEARTVRNDLVWLLNMLSGRKTYQKKQQIKRKLIDKLIKQQLSPDEIKRLNAQATREASLSTLSDKIVNGTTDQVDQGDTNDNDD